MTDCLHGIMETMFCKIVFTTAKVVVQVKTNGQFFLFVKVLMLNQPNPTSWKTEQVIQMQNY